MVFDDNYLGRNISRTAELASDIEGKIFLASSTLSVKMFAHKVDVKIRRDSSNTTDSGTIVSNTEVSLVLEVSNILLAPDGKYRAIRSLGGVLADSWLSVYESGQTNNSISVRW